MITLYTWPTPNGQKIQIILEEFSIDYELKPVNILRNEQFAEDFLAISPNNKIPAMDRPPSGFAGLTKRRRTKPVVAAVNGVALGGGFEIVLACDIAVSVPHARFQLPEVCHGLVPLAGMHLLPRSIPPKIAREILLSVRALTASEALQLSLINAITFDKTVLDTAKAIAKRIVLGSPQAISTCLDIMHKRAIPDVFEALENQYDSLDRLRRGADFLEGPHAFAEHRKPRWVVEEDKGVSA